MSRWSVLFCWFRILFRLSCWTIFFIGCNKLSQLFRCQIIANGDFELNPVTSWESQIPSNWQSRSGCFFVVASYCNAWGGGVPAPSGSFYVAVQ
eukprot:gene36133-48646_t